jgi:hypothetical protein
VLHRTAEGGCPYALFIREICNPRPSLKFGIL